MIECRYCQHKNADEMNFCGICGHPLTRDERTPTIKTEPTDAHPTDAPRKAVDYTPGFLRDTVLTSRPALVGENKQVAIPFADVVGFTGIAEKISPENLHGLMEGCFNILGHVIHSTGGTINQYTGDGIMAIVGAPAAVEAYIAKACYAALEIQHRLTDYRRYALATFDINFQMRIGINAGPVLVGAIGDNLRLDYTAAGDTTNLAARLQASAAPGTIYVSKPVADAVDHLFDFKKLGLRRFKGKSHPQQIFQLTAEKKKIRLDFRIIACDKTARPQKGIKRFRGCLDAC